MTKLTHDEVAQLLGAIKSDTVHRELKSKAFAHMYGGERPSPDQYEFSDEFVRMAVLSANGYSATAKASGASSRGSEETRRINWVGADGSVLRYHVCYLPLAPGSTRFLEIDGHEFSDLDSAQICLHCDYNVDDFSASELPETSAVLSRTGNIELTLELLNGDYPDICEAGLRVYGNAPPHAIAAYLRRVADRLDPPVPAPPIALEGEA